MQEVKSEDKSGRQNRPRTQEANEIWKWQEAKLDEAMITLNNDFSPFSIISSYYGSCIRQSYPKIEISSSNNNSLKCD